MKLYVVDYNNVKHYLDTVAASRHELASQLGSELLLTVGGTLKNS